MTPSHHVTTDSAAVNTPQVVPTREGYDRWAPIYDVEENSLIALETPWVRQLLGEVRGLTVADIGCGTGRHAYAMAAAGATVWGWICPLACWPRPVPRRQQWRYISYTTI